MRKTYSEYQPTRFPWLSMIPSHWRVLPIKHLVEIPVTDGPHETPDFLDEGIPFVSAEAISNGGIDFDRKRGFISLEDHHKYSKKYHPQLGDIYIVKSGATTGKVAIVETDMDFNIWSPLAAVRPNRSIALSKYLYYFMQSRSFVQAIESGWNYGTQQNIGMGTLENIAVPVPSLIEQRAIGRFLDQQTAKIDALIAQKRQLITLLHEKRTALISHAVTKGLDPNAPMKDSGVEWIGQMPANWQIERSKWLFALRKTKAKAEDKQITVSQKYGPICQDEFVELEGRRVMEVIKGADILQHIEPNDFVISMRSFQGGIEYCGHRGCVSSAYVVLIPAPAVNESFFAYLLKSSQYIQALRGTTNLIRDGQAIRYGHFVLVDLPLPPYREQGDIAKYLDMETQHIDALLVKLEAAIEKLSEYRTALISAAVTGQIDVRPASLSRKLQSFRESEGK